MMGSICPLNTERGRGYQDWDDEDEDDDWEDEDEDEEYEEDSDDEDL